MDKIYLCNHIKLEILNVCGLATNRSYNLAGSVPLASLGYDDKASCKLLEDRLRLIVTQYNTGKLISSGIISNNFTVSECIRLVLT